MAEGLALAFPEADSLEHRTIFLAETQMARVNERAGKDASLAGELVTSYTARRGGEAIGTAYLDTHLVRTLSETVLISVDARGKLIRADILRFEEPPEYRAPGPWLEHLRGRDLSGGLVPGRDVHAITGATLTSRSVTRAVRRVLALHEVLSADASAHEQGAGREEAPTGSRAETGPEDGS